MQRCPRHGDRSQPSLGTGRCQPQARVSLAPGLQPALQHPPLAQPPPQTVGLQLCPPALPRNNHLPFPITEETALAGPARAGGTGHPPPRTEKGQRTTGGAQHLPVTPARSTPEGHALGPVGQDQARPEGPWPGTS